jgi:hypothetical protein
VATDAELSASELLATVQSGDLPGPLRDYALRVWRDTARQQFWSLFSVSLILVGVVTSLFWVIGISEQDKGALLIGILVTLTYLLIFAVWPLRQYLKLRGNFQADLAAGRVKTVRGQITWRLNNYQMEFAGSNPSMAACYRLTGAMPGAYSFSVLPRSGFVVLAEPDANSDWRARLTSTLAGYMGYTADDLALNQQHQLAPRQRGRLWTRTAIVSLLALGAFVLAVSEIVLYHLSLVPLLFSGIFVATGLYLFANALRLVRDARSSIVNVAQGEIALAEQRPQVERHIAVGGVRLPVSLPLWNALPARVTYAVYYAPRSRRIVSIEPLATASN